MKCHDQPERKDAAARIDMRNSMDFFCLLKACALVKRLAPGESVHFLANDRNFLADLRRVHPDCILETVPCVTGPGEDAEYLVRVRRSAPEPDEHTQGCDGPMPARRTHRTLRR